MPPHRDNPNLAFKFIAAALVLTIYTIIQFFRSTPDGTAPTTGVNTKFKNGATIQSDKWKTGNAPPDTDKAKRVEEAMRFTYEKYKSQAWGHDDVLPVSGGYSNSRNGWGAFIVDTSTTLALMGMWEELQEEVEYIINKVDFAYTDGLVDPFETTIRYIGGLVSLVDLVDASVVPVSVIPKGKRDLILAQAVVLAHTLGPSYDSPTGLIWPRVDFDDWKGVDDDTPRPDKPKFKNPVISPARAGSTILEARTLSRLTSNPIYLLNSTRAWSPIVWPKYIFDTPGLVSGPMDIMTGELVGSMRHWDAGHDSYYEYLLKIGLLAPKDRYISTYKDRWLAAADALRYQLTSRSQPSKSYTKQHLFMGKANDAWYLNTQSHLACFAPGNLILGGQHLNRKDLIHLGQALLDGCHHSYATTATGIGPETFSWLPGLKMTGPLNSTFTPTTARQQAQLDAHGIWAVDSRYRLRPEYIESLFYAWRITGEQRYRDWAWDAFQAIEKHCKAPYGYAALADVGGERGHVQQLDESESFWGAETLKYFWLIFTSGDKASLNQWVFTTEGHPLRMIR